MMNGARRSECGMGSAGRKDCARRCRPLDLCPRPSVLRPPRRRPAGMVLFIVVIVVAMLSLAGLNFVSVLYTENKAVQMQGDELQLQCLVLSGVESIKAFAEQTPERRREAGGWFDNPELFRSVAVLDEAARARSGRFTVVAPRIENGEITGIRFGVENESTRLNLTVLPRWEEEHEGAARQALMALPGMSESIADAVLDWLDADTAPRQFGAETDHYLGRNLPYGPRNAMPTSLEELLLVRDVTREMLFGADANYNYQIDPHEAEYSAGLPHGGFAGAGLPWAALLTVFSAERNLTPQGSPPIDLNQHDLPALHQQLTEVFDPSWADFIVAYRQFGPYNEETRSAEGKGPRATGRAPTEGSSRRIESSQLSAIAKLDFSKPARFKISSILDLVGVEVEISGSKEKDRRSILESPFVDDSGRMREYLPTLLDFATVEESPVIRGRINVNQAPRAVLQSVPEMDEVTVEKIVAARGQWNAEDDPNRRHPTWLLTEGLVDLSEMRAILPYLTSGGDVFRAQVVGSFDGSSDADHGHARVRAEVVIDATSTPPRQVYWKDLRLLGAGYSFAEALQ